MGVSLFARDIWSAALIALIALGMVSLQIDGVVWERAALGFSLISMVALAAAWVGWLAVPSAERKRMRSEAGNGERIAAVALSFCGGAAMGGLLPEPFAAPVVASAGLGGLWIVYKDERWGNLAAVGVGALVWFVGGAIYATPLVGRIG